MTVKRNRLDERLFGRRVTRWLCKLLLSLSIAFVGVEAILFVFEGWFFYDSFYVFDPDLGFRVRPYARYGEATANEFGFNDRDYPHQRAAGIRRILFLSDSFNWMGGPECNYTALLERDFEELFGEPRVEVISAGYSQTHTGEQLAVLRKFGLAYQPDLVVLGFYAGNDFFDAHPARRRIVFAGTPVDVYTDRDFHASLLGRPLLVQSRLFVFLREQWILWRNAAWRGFPGWPVESGVEPLKPVDHDAVDCGSWDRRPPLEVGRQKYLDLVGQRFQFCNPARAAVWRPHIEYVFESLLEMKRLLDARQIGLIVAVYPDEVQVDADLRAELRATSPEYSGEIDWERPQSLLQGFCRVNGIEYHDLLPVFRSARADGHHLYLPNDSHWNAAGNQLAADFFLELLSQRMQ